MDRRSPFLQPTPRSGCLPGARLLPLVVLLVALGGGLLFAGEDEPTSCDPTSSDPTSREPATASPEAPGAGAGPAPGLPADVTVDEHGDPVGLHRYRRWSARLGQGAQPEGDEAFANLKRLGFTTIVSVDGSMPDVAAATRHGLRYIHIPIGYDGVPREAALKMIRAVQLSDGPVFFHCHHGKHRGPAGCAMPAMALDGVTAGEAVERLAQSKTGHEYAGLYRDVAAFRPPTQAELDALGNDDLPSVVLPAGLRAAMVLVDERFEHLKAAQKEAFVRVTGHDDIAPAHEALMLEEAFREIARLTEVAEHGEVFAGFNADSEAAAKRLGAALRANDQPAADAEMEILAGLCASCHHDYRN